MTCPLAVNLVKPTAYLLRCRAVGAKTAARQLTRKGTTGILNIDQIDDGLRGKRSATERQMAPTQPAEPTRTASQLPQVEGSLAFDSRTASNAGLFDLLEL